MTDYKQRKKVKILTTVCVLAEDPRFSKMPVKTNENNASAIITIKNTERCLI